MKGAAKGAAVEGAKGAAQGAVKGGQKGAQIGGKLGSVVPGAGTAIGGVVGGTVGTGVGAGVGGAKGAAKGAAKEGAKGAAKGAGDGGLKGAKNSLTKPERPLGGGSFGDASDTADDGKSSPDLDGTAAADMTKGAAIGGAKGAAKGMLKGGVAGAITGAAGGAIKGAGKNKKGGLVAAAMFPIMGLGVVFLLILATLTSVGGGEESTAQAATYAAVRDDVPPYAASIYMGLESGSGIPWELLASIGENQTSNGTDAPDGVERAWPDDPYADDLIGEANVFTDDGYEDENGVSAAGGTDTKAEETTTTVKEGEEPAKDGSVGFLYPSALPPIVDNNWLGMFLIGADAWTATGLPLEQTQDPVASAAFIADALRSYRETLPNEESLSFEGDRDAWVASILALPIKGLSGDEANKRVAEQIYETALAWMRGEQMCAAGSTSGLGAVGLPTAGPVKIGDVLQYQGHGVVFTEEAWQYSVIIAKVAASLGLSDRAIVIALATIIVESNMVNLNGGDRDSQGLYQQRPSMGWGTVAEVTDPEHATRSFFGGPSGPNFPSPKGLIDVANWETIDPGKAAQTVQGSGFPDRYTLAMTDAVGILATLNASGYGQGAGGTTTPPADGTATTVPADGTAPAPAPGGAPTKAFLVGDSLVVGAKDSGKLPGGWTVDAAVGRHVSEGVAIIEGTDLSAYDAVIVALGANDASLDQASMADLIARVMTKAGTTIPVTWVNVDTGSPGLAGASAGVNPAIAAAAFPNFKAADWAAKAASIEGFAAMRAADGIHYNVDGYKQYAEFIATAGTGLTNPSGLCGSAAGAAGVEIDINTGLPIELCPIQNARTNCQIVDELTAMIAAAAADGTTLTVGNSYRSSAEQIELRKAHCGTSHYAIYEMSSSSCHPPTARPGSSQHEKGLAIDWASCSSRGSACYKWLASNAESYGFYNLPSEAWHWSVNGK